MPARFTIAARRALDDPREIRAALERRRLRRQDASTIAHFHSEDYLTINGRRLEHLASLELPLEERTVLEVGAGIGDLTTFFVARGCTVLATEGRLENLRVLRDRLPNVEAAQLDLNAPTLNWTRTADIVFCYGTLYHLEHPAEAIEFLRRSCTDVLLLETCVSPAAGVELNPQREPAAIPTQAVSGMGCRPTRGWLQQELGRHFPYVYFTRTQPWHAQFPLDWSSPTPGPTRAIAVASLSPIDNPLLVTELPSRQEHH
jgi:Methyltransferase domain